MLQNRRLRLLLTLALAIIGLVVIAAGLSNLRFGPGEPTVNLFGLLIQGLSERRLLSDLGDGAGGDGLLRVILGTLRYIIWFGIPATLIYAFFDAKTRKRLLSLLAFVFLIAFMLNRLDPRTEEDAGAEEGGFAEAPGAVAEALPATPEIVAAPPGWLTALIALALALAVVVSIWLVWRRLKLLQPDVRSELVEAAEQTLADLDRGADVRDAVLRCYADMTRHFGADRKLVRRTGMTPREFAAHLAAAGVDDEHIHRLTRLFETVRYGGRVSDEPMAQEARACLNSIVSSYGRDP